MTTAFATENIDGQADIAAEVDTMDARRTERIADEVEKAYQEFAIQQAAENTDMDATEAILKESAEIPSMTDRSKLCDKIDRALRPTAQVRVLTRIGRCYEIRKDHGTVARQREIKAENAAIAESQQSKRTIRRRSNRNKAKSGNPRRFAAALKRQAKQAPRTRRVNLIAQYDIGDINVCPTCYGSLSSIADGSCTYGYCIERDYNPEWLDEDWMF